jgi:tetratricopeptide (TPR) repeat protein
MINKWTHLRRRNEKDCVYLFQLRSYLENTRERGTGQAVEHYIPRLFPVDPDIFYTGVIHENITHTKSLDQFQAMALPGAIIHHYGYTKEELQRKSRTDRNAPLLRKALEIEPENPYVHYNYAMYLFGIDRKGEALDEYLKCQELITPGYNPPYLPTTYVYSAQIMLDHGLPGEAVRMLKTALEITPNACDALYAMGKAHEALRKMDRAEEYFLKALKSQDDAPTYFGVSDLSTATWKPCVKLGTIYSERDEWEKACGYFEKAHEFIPQLKIIGTDLGLCYYNLGRVKDALALWVETYPEGFNQLALLFDYVDALAATGRLDKAIEIVDLVEKHNPEVPDVVRKKAQLLREGGRSDNAVEALSRRIAEKPSASLLVDRGVAWLALNEAERAFEDFSAAVALDPRDQRAWNNLGSLCMARGELKKATECFQNAVAIDDTNSPSLANLAKVHLLAREYEEASRLLERAVEKDAKKSRDYYILLAETWLGLARAQAAESLARGLIAEAPEDREVIHLLARALGAQGKTDEAVALYMGLIESNPGHVKLYEEAGQLLLSAGKFKEALQIIDRGMAISGGG